MDLKIEAINRNDTCELMELPDGRNKVGVKWKEDHWESVLTYI